MMKMIRSRCPRCGDVEMPSDVVVLSVSEDVQHGSYTYVCPTCGDVVEKEADRKIIELLSETEARLDGIGDDWDGAFALELSCDGTHRWDFPVKMGQRCLCGEAVWEK